MAATQAMDADDESHEPVSLLCPGSDNDSTAAGSDSGKLDHEQTYMYSDTGEHPYIGWVPDCMERQRSHAQTHAMLCTYAHVKVRTWRSAKSGRAR